MGVRAVPVRVASSGKAWCLVSALCLLPAACCLTGCSSDEPGAAVPNDSTSRALRDPMNYSPDFGPNADKADKGAAAQRGGKSAAGATGGQQQPQKESDWDGFKKDLDHVFNP